MRIIVQRVSQASVTVNDEMISSIGKGLLLLAAIETADTKDDLNWIAQKIAGLRIFDDEQQIPNLSVQDIKGEILIVSQFTLFASTRKGNRPGYSRAAVASVAEPLFLKFIQEVHRITDINIHTGKFGADMQVRLVNEGPLTIMIDSKLKE